MRDALTAALLQYRECEPLLSRDDNVEPIHKARVAVRKLRSHLKSFAPVLDRQWARELRARLHAVQDVLAPVRDADVFALNVRDLTKALEPRDAADAAELITTFDEAALRARGALRAYLRTPAYASLMHDLADASGAPVMRTTTDDLQRSMNRIMRRSLREAKLCVRQAGADPSDRALHRIRISAKHLRYAAESFASLKGKRATRYAARVEALQEMLGAQHDAVVAHTRLHAFRGSDAARFAAGELAAIAARRGRFAAKHWRRCWKAIRRKRNRFW